MIQCPTHPKSPPLLDQAYTDSDTDTQSSESDAANGYEVIMESVLTAALTNIAEHLNAALHTSLLTWDQPVAVVDPEHALQELHEHRLPSLKERERERERANVVIHNNTGTQETPPQKR